MLQPSAHREHNIHLSKCCMDARGAMQAMAEAQRANHGSRTGQAAWRVGLSSLRFTFDLPAVLVLQSLVVLGSAHGKMDSALQASLDPASIFAHQPHAWASSGFDL
jgi:hypothetical protein